MTVCIGALANRKKQIVLAADKMISLGFPMAYEYETDDVYKIYELTDKSVALIAGNAQFAYEIIDNVKKKLSIGTFASIKDIAELVRKEYQAFRLKIISQQVLEPRNMTIGDYYNKQNSLHPGVVQEIEKRLTEDNIGVEIIIAGYDTDEAHLYSIYNPGIMIDNNAVGYVAIGIGAPHATYSLIDSEYNRNKTVEEVKELVKTAKKRSEKAPGVGTQTTIRVLPERVENGQE